VRNKSLTYSTIKLSFILIKLEKIAKRMMILLLKRVMMNKISLIKKFLSDTSAFSITISKILILFSI
jgi:hypothetical protein